MTKRTRTLSFLSFIGLVLCGWVLVSDQGYLARHVIGLSMLTLVVALLARRSRSTEQARPPHG